MSDWRVKNLLEIEDSLDGGDIQARFSRKFLDSDVVVRVAPHVVRAFEVGPDGLEVIAVGGRKPADGTESSTPIAGPRPRSLHQLPGQGA